MDRSELLKRRTAAARAREASQLADLAVNEIQRVSFYRYSLELSELYPDQPTVKVTYDLTGAYENMSIPVDCIDSFCGALQKLKALAPNRGTR